MRCRARGVAVVAVTLFGVAGGASAQHIAPPERGFGVVLPQAFFSKIALDPQAFTLPNGLFRTNAAGAPMAGETFGEKRMLLIPALFADSPEPHVSSQAIAQVLFTGPSPRGTLTQAYQEMSRGLFSVTGDVVPWTRTSLTRAAVVGDTAGIGEDARVGEYLIEALDNADSLVDFGDYDSDGPDGIPNSGDDDGIVDAIAFEFIEVAGSCGGPGIWPHSWGIEPQNGGAAWVSDDLRPDGSHVTVNAYIVQSAVDCDGVTIQSAGTIAHEFGHVLGLPDYYHPTAAGGADGRRWVLGCWELMAAGSWGCGPVGSTRTTFGPTHVSARSKNSLGWLKYVTVGEVWDQDVFLDPVQKSGEALRIPLDEVGREYLLVEYRQKTGFDRDLPAEGILVYHQDFKGLFRPAPGSSDHYFLSLVEQDANSGLVRNSYEGGNRGEAGDAFGVGGAVGRLHGATTPSLLRHDGKFSTVAIHAMEVKDGRARLRLSTGRVPRVVAPPAPLTVTQVTPFQRRLRVAGGAMPYIASGDLPPGVTVAAEGDELVVAGLVTSPGPFSLALRVTDSRGTPSESLFVTLAAQEWLVGEDRLLQPFLRSSAQPLTSVESAYLDQAGNGNGRYDVGDLRAWLRNRPSGS